MITEERLPPACAFAVSVLAERDIDPDAVPEEAVEAAQQHMATCPRCVNAQSPELPDSPTSTPRRKKKIRRTSSGQELDYSGQAVTQSFLTKAAPDDREQDARASAPTLAQTRTEQVLEPSTTPEPEPLSRSAAPLRAEPAVTSLALSQHEVVNCQQCRQVLQEYAEAMDNGQNVAMLYPEIHTHLLSCESGCLVLLDIFRQEAKTMRKYRRRPVRNPFSAIGWELTGFFRSGQVPIAPMALSYGTLILLILVASLSTYLGIRWDDARYYHPIEVTIPTPDGIGLSDGLKVYDACNASSYYDKREAAQAMQNGNSSSARSLLKSAMSTSITDTTGCNGAEAAIYLEDLQVRESGRPYSVVVVSFDSGPGKADPQGGTDRHVLYAASTQELVGAFIGQQQYNQRQMQTQGDPLLYLVLANTVGTEQGALQIVNSVASLTSGAMNAQQFGLLIPSSVKQHPIIAVLGLGPSNLVRVALPTMCRIGMPLITPSATGLFILDLLTSTSLYRHCAPGFAFVRFSPDDGRQSSLAAAYAYNRMNMRYAATFYDPTSPSSAEYAHSFSDSFIKYSHARIVAQETASAENLLDTNEQIQNSHNDLLAGLKDALQAKSRPELIYAPLLTNDVMTLAQMIARLPRDKQPILMVSGEYAQPAALQKLVLWARQQQLSLPRVFVLLPSAARSPTDTWQKQFYASYCTSFATAGSFCSGAAALDQGALMFGDGIETIVRAVGPIHDIGHLPTTARLVESLSQEQFAGVSCPIALHIQNNVVVTSATVQPAILSIQEDGSFQVVG